jgi:hypothetical protein
MGELRPELEPLRSQALRQLKGDGLSARDGLAFAELEPLVGKPGVARLDAVIK